MATSRRPRPHPPRSRLHRQPLPVPPAVRAVAVALAVALVLAACGGDDEGASANAAAGHVDNGATLVVASSAGTLSVNGPQRVLVALVGEGPNDFFGETGKPGVFELTSPGGETEQVTADFLATEGVALGLYVVRTEFDQAGRWEIAVSGTDELRGRSALDVADDAVIPEQGEPAPLSETPTAEDPADIGLISTDLDPDPSFYRLSIAEAVANGRPTVIVFATPAFCLTALCGPTLDTVKEAVDGVDGLDVVHVEPFDIAKAQGGSLEPVPTMFDWQLVTEPWVFVVDAEGLVSASFEGTVGRAELVEAVAAVTES